MSLIDIVRKKKRLMAAPLVGYPGAMLTGTGVIDNLQKAEVQAGSMIALYERYGFDVIFNFMDLSVEAEALGLAVEFHDEGAPDVREHPISNSERLAGLRVPDPLQDGRMPVFADAIRLAKEHIDTLVAGYVTSPFTLSGLLMGAENLAIGTLMDPALSKACLQFTADCVIPYALAQQQAGADMVVLLDPTAVLLSPRLYDEFAKPYIEQVSNALDIPVVLHICGQTTPLMPNLVSTHVAGLSLDSEVDLAEIMPQIPEDMVVLGNIPPVSTMLYGNVEQVKDEVDSLMDDLHQYPNFIISTGCDLPLLTPLDNLNVFASEVFAGLEESRDETR